MVSELILWVLTVPIAGFYWWAMWGRPKLSMRIIAAVVFFTFWLAAPAVVGVDVVWRYAMPSLVALVMLGMIIRPTLGAKPRGVDGADT